MKQPNTIEGKTKEEKVEYLNSLPYSVLLKQKNDKFYLLIPELSLVGVSDNLEEAYKELYDQKQKLLTRLIDCEAEDEITLPRKTHAIRDTFHQIKVFIYKLVIVCVIGGLTLATSGALIVNKTAQISVTDIFMNQIKSIIFRAEKFIANAPEERKQERLKKIQRFVEELRPIAHELQTLLALPVQEEEENDKEFEKQNNGDSK